MRIMLDTSALALLSHPNSELSGPLTRSIANALVDGFTRIYIPEIADYELRRELIRAGKTKSLARLDALESKLDYIPLTTRVMREAALLWAEARNRGRGTAHEKALDGDVILAAQAREVAAEVWTTNERHLKQFVKTRDISSI